MSGELIFFALFALGAVGGSVGVLLNRNPVNSALSLVVSFFFLAGIYILLNAQFLAVLQVMVYAGAIMVLFIFVLMLLNLRSDELGVAKVSSHKVAGAGVAVATCLVIAASFAGSTTGGRQVWGPSLPASYGSAETIGRHLVTTHVLMFELVAVLLLVGIVGAVVVAKKRL